ncbi:MAG: T9SS type A sorting domain-containing protein [Bacteroidales bacterium]|nr:T9SS type A sorting domain-containing protein [Bacteroidales bacterium]
MKHRLLILSSILFISLYTYSQQVEIELRRINGQGNGGISLELKSGMYDSIINSSLSFYPHLVYQPENGPVDIQINNHQVCPKGLFSISFTGISDTSKWKLYSFALDTTITSDSTIYSDYIQDISQWGIQIRTKPVKNPGEETNSFYNGYLNSKMIWEDSSRMWLDFVADNDSYTSLNWIRSGHLLDHSIPEYNDWNMPSFSYDYYEGFENVLNGCWSPYLLVAARSQKMESPAYSIESKLLNDFQKLSSIDLIITDDSTRWSRCCVIEMCSNSDLAQGNAKPFSCRNHPSVNINGDTNISGSNLLFNSNYINPQGMGWFPGYAINVETGERLNIMFGENSWLSGENGKDMIWNPTNNILDYPSFFPIFGGQHFIYIMGAVSIDSFNFPRYDGCQYIHNILSEDQNNFFKNYIYASTYWVGIPLKSEYHEWLCNDVRIKIRVSKRYDFFENNELPQYTFNNNINSYADITNIITFYPNPVSGKLQFILDDTIVGKEVKIVVYDIRGQQVIKIVFPYVNKRNEIDVSSIKDGIYLIEINADSQNFSQKIIVNN